ncbi:MAG: tRNA (adenosine(37)-N6)-threonylcarbamoyltransferase complex ATPase subunit type 1 TsaE [Parachlamydiales bacterium]|jgi:tRNA threonylcarbamoyladenosine biosynthesis protein TsaE
MSDPELPFESFSASAEETRLCGRNLASKVKKGELIAFVGDLGAGKTTLIKGLVSALNGTDEKQVTSPTFTYLNIYPGKINVYHFDLYRIQDADHFAGMGFDEYLHPLDGITLVEWSEKITSLLPAGTWMVHLLSLSENNRKIAFLKL